MIHTFFAAVICLFLKSSFHFKCKKLNKTLKSYSNDSANLISGLWVISFRFFWGLTHFSSFSHQCFKCINRWVITLIASVRNISFHIWLYQYYLFIFICHSSNYVWFSRNKLFMIIQWIMTRYFVFISFGKKCVLLVLVKIRFGLSLIDRGNIIVRFNGPRRKIHTNNSFLFLNLFLYFISISDPVSKTY